MIEFLLKMKFIRSKKVRKPNASRTPIPRVWYFISFKILEISNLFLFFFDKERMREFCMILS